MDFYAVLDEVLELLQRHKRVTSRALKRQFGLDDAYLEDLKAEIIEARQLAFDQDGTMLVWGGDLAAPPPPTAAPVSVQNRTPLAYTSKYLAEKILTARSALEGERKQVAVLCADVAGFTTLAEQLDPEVVHDLINRCFEGITAEVHRCEGTINQYTGDGVMALFGAPLAHEDSPRRAVHATLGIQRAIRGIAQALQAERGLSLQTALMAKAEGVPLFIEEVTKTLLDLGVLQREPGGYRLVKHLGEVSVPDTIQGIIMARLGLLGEDGKRTVQLASVIGRQFLVRLLARIAGVSERLEGLLRELQALEIIYEQGLVPEPAYIFKHAVIQDVAYNSLLMQRRKTLHRAFYHQALALADELGMRPLLAHCHFGLGILYNRIGRPEQARTELAAAIELYRAMEMTFWLDCAEMALVQGRERGK